MHKNVTHNRCHATYITVDTYVGVDRRDVARRPGAPNWDKDDAVDAEAICKAERQRDEEGSHLCC